MVNRIKKSYSSGESLTELLVASLIISLAMIMLFSGIKVGTDIMRNSRNQYKEYNDLVNTYELEQAEYVKLYGKYYLESSSVSLEEPEAFSFSIVPDRDNLK